MKYVVTNFKDIPCIIYLLQQTTTGGIKRLSGPRSRADAMLERAQCNLDISRSPLQVARSRYIPVWNVEKVNYYIRQYIFIFGIQMKKKLS